MEFIEFTFISYMDMVVCGVVYSYASKCKHTPNWNTTSIRRAHSIYLPFAYNRLLWIASKRKSVRQTQSKKWCDGVYEIIFEFNACLSRRKYSFLLSKKKNQHTHQITLFRARMRACYLARMCVAFLSFPNTRHLPIIWLSVNEFKISASTSKPSFYLETFIKSYAYFEKSIGENDMQSNPV